LHCARRRCAAKQPIRENETLQLCAGADLRRGSCRTADGRDEIVVRVVCPVCGQFGPAVAAAGKDEAVAGAEAVAAWNTMISRLRPLEA
jgi:hypothetical protein